MEVWFSVAVSWFWIDQHNSSTALPWHWLLSSRWKPCWQTHTSVRLTLTHFWLGPQALLLQPRVRWEQWGPVQPVLHTHPRSASHRSAPCPQPQDSTQLSPHLPRAAQPENRAEMWWACQFYTQQKCFTEPGLRRIHCIKFDKAV